MKFHLIQFVTIFFLLILSVCKPVPPKTVNDKDELENLIADFSATYSPAKHYTLYTKEDNYVEQKKPYRKLRFYVVEQNSQTIVYYGNLLDGSITWESDHILRIEEATGRVQGHDSNKVVYTYDLVTKRRMDTGAVKK